METEGKGIESKRLVDKIWNLEAEKNSLLKENESLKKKVVNKQVEIHELRRRTDSFGSTYSKGKLVPTENESDNDDKSPVQGDDHALMMQKTLEKVSADKEAMQSEKKVLQQQLETKETELKAHEAKVAKLLLEQKGLYQEKRISQKIMLDREEEIKRLVFKLWQLLDELTSGAADFGTPTKKSMVKNQKILLLQQKVQNLMSDMNVIGEVKDKKDESRKQTDSNTSHDENGKSTPSPNTGEKTGVSAFVKKFEGSRDTKSDKEESSNAATIQRLNNKIEVLQAENNRLQQDKRSIAYEMSQKMEEINDLKQQHQSINNDTNGHDDSIQSDGEFSCGFITDKNKDKIRLPLETAQIQFPNVTELISASELIKEKQNLSSLNSDYLRRLNQLNANIKELKETISSLEDENVLNEKSKEEKETLIERQMTQIQDLEKEKNLLVIENTDLENKLKEKEQFARSDDEAAPLLQSRRESQIQKYCGCCSIS